MAKILCDQVMTKTLVTCRADDTVLDAARVLARQHIGALPVVEDEESYRLLGVLTDRDIVLRVVANGNQAKDIRVGDVMSTTLVTCAPADDLHDAVRLMMEKQVRRLLVVEDGRLVGVIAQADVASRGGERNMTAQVVEAVSQPKP